MQISCHYGHLQPVLARFHVEALKRDWSVAGGGRSAGRELAGTASIVVSIDIEPGALLFPAVAQSCLWLRKRPCVSVKVETCNVRGQSRRAGFGLELGWDGAHLPISATLAL